MAPLKRDRAGAAAGEKQLNAMAHAAVAAPAQ